MTSLPSADKLKEKKKMSQSTKCIHAGYEPANGEPRLFPIVQATTFKYDASEDMGKLFDLEADGYFYTRLQNPTNDHTAAKIAALEGGTAGMLTSSGQAAAEFLEKQPDVAWINYPGLPSSRYYERAKKYMPEGTCGVVFFGVKGGRKAAEEFMKHLHIAGIETHVADARTCILHPASSTHRQLTDEELRACGVEPDMVRLSVGLEDMDDIIADLKQALEAI